MNLAPLFHSSPQSPATRIGFGSFKNRDSDSLQIEEFKHILKVCSHKPCNKNETKQLMLRIKGEETFYPELEVTKKEFLREMTSNVPLSLGAMTSQHKVIKHLERQQLKSTFLSSSVQILLLFHAPFSAKGFLYFDCHIMGEKSFIQKKTRKDWNKLLCMYNIDGVYQKECWHNI